jgi:hypothetical protein
MTGHSWLWAHILSLILLSASWHSQAQWALPNVRWSVQWLDLWDGDSSLFLEVSKAFFQSSHSLFLPKGRHLCGASRNKDLYYLMIWNLSGLGLLLGSPLPPQTSQLRDGGSEHSRMISSSCNNILPNSACPLLLRNSFLFWSTKNTPSCFSLILWTDYFKHAISFLSFVGICIPLTILIQSPVPSNFKGYNFINAKGKANREHKTLEKELI